MAESSAGKRQGLPRQQQIPSDGVLRVRRFLANYCLNLQHSKFSKNYPAAHTISSDLHCSPLEQGYCLLLVNYCLILQRILGSADLPEKPG